MAKHSDGLWHVEVNDCHAGWCGKPCHWQFFDRLIAQVAKKAVEKWGKFSRCDVADDTDMGAAYVQQSFACGLKIFDR
jgi:hypothetical protein